jgi:hypothetical protein
MEVLRVGRSVISTHRSLERLEDFCLLPCSGTSRFRGRLSLPSNVFLVVR